MNFLIAHQLDIMLFMSGICGILAVLAMMTKSLSHRRRRIITQLEFAAMLLLISDRQAYIYRGDTSALGFWMVRISNFLVYFLILFLTHSIMLYLFDLFRNEGKMTVMPRRLYICEILYVIGTILIIISQFTGLYYTFDAQNTYQRAPANIICYFIPFYFGAADVPCASTSQAAGAYHRFLSDFKYHDPPSLRPSYNYSPMDYL